MIVKRLFPVALAATAVVSVLVATPALAAGNAPDKVLGFSLFGDAEKLGDGARLRSDAAVAPGFGGIDFKLPRPVPFGEVTQLGTAFDPTDDTCGGGSPRFQLNIDTDNDGDFDANVFAYPGTLPNYTCDSPGDSGNLVGSTEPRFDASPIGGGIALTHAQAAEAVGSGTVLGIQLVVDGSFTQPDGEQTVEVDPTVAIDRR